MKPEDKDFVIMPAGWAFRTPLWWSQMKRSVIRMMIFKGNRISMR